MTTTFTVFRKCLLRRTSDTGAVIETYAVLPLWACKVGLDYFYGSWTWTVAEIYK